MTENTIEIDLVKRTNRACGECTLCCKLVPVEELNKPALTRCRYQFRGGCRVYDRLAIVSSSCALWSCAWLMDDAVKTQRPDRAGYVIDTMPDFVGMSFEGEDAPISIQVLQVWADPDRPDAIRDPALRAYIEHVAETRHMATLVRFGSGGDPRSFAIFAPCLASDGEWHEQRSELQRGDSTWENPMDYIHSTAQAIRRARARR